MQDAAVLTPLPPSDTHGRTGLFITLEGIDGCGKSTQARLLAETLTAEGHSVYLTKNPGDTRLGQGLRQLLLHTDNPIHARAEMLLYVADRTQHWFERILPSLQNGQIVICDRYIDSTLAYQGYGRGESLDWIMDLHAQALSNPYRSYWPDITLWLDAPADVCLNRLAQRGATKDRLENEPEAFYERIRQGFQALHQQYPNRIHRMDASGSAQAIAQAMASTTRPLLPVSH